LADKSKDQGRQDILDKMKKHKVEYAKNHYSDPNTMTFVNPAADMGMMGDMEI